MSTELKKINGRSESFWTDEMHYVKNEISLTKFNGGENGIMLQLTMRSHGNDMFAHIQLTRKEAIQLVEEIQNKFINE